MSAKGRGPTAHSTIRRMRNSRLGWASALGELIDNSCGNGATTVTVRLTPTTCEVRDDGNGCNERMFAALQSLDWHEEDRDHPNPTSVYGIGSKDAVIWAGGPTEYYSIRDTARYTLVDWDDFGDSWSYADPVVGAAAAERCKAIKLNEHGTVIRMPHHTRQINRSSFDALVKALAAQHWAAVETGIVIRVEFVPRSSRTPVGGVLSGKPLPEFIDGKSIDAAVTLADGRKIRIIGGVLDPSVRMSQPGFEYIFGHRVVVPCGGLGAGQLCFERVYFRVLLLGDKSDWNPTTNKVGLHDSDEAALGEAVFRECKSLLDQAQHESIATLLEQELENEISEMLSEDNRRRAKRRGAENPTGTIDPKSTGRQHQIAARTQDSKGNIKSKAGARLSVKLVEFDEQNAHLIGKAAVRDRIIRLNKLHSAVSEATALSAKHELRLIAYAIWSDEWTRTDDTGHSRLNGIERGTFIDKLSAMLKNLRKEQEA